MVEIIFIFLLHLKRQEWKEINQYLRNLNFCIKKARLQNANWQRFNLVMKSSIFIHMVCRIKININLWSFLSN